MKTFLQKAATQGLDRATRGSLVDGNVELQKPDTVWTHSGLPAILETIPVNCKSLVDLGCGRGIIGALCRIYRAPQRLVGVDAFEPYLVFCRQRGFYDEILSHDLREAPLPFQTGEFDVATCIEVIEHLPKDKGKTLLAELERVASCVIVTTPGIWFEQDDYDGNLLQRHLSFWKVSEFLDRGYRVWGVGALSLGYEIRTVMSRVIGKRGMILAQKGIRGAAHRISAALGPLTHSWPRLSTKLLCVRISEPNSATKVA